MATYRLDGMGSAVAYNGPGALVFSKEIDCAAVAAGTVKLNLLTGSTWGSATTLPAGFSQNDILFIGIMPAGTLLTVGGIKCTTAEGATCSIDFGTHLSTTTCAEIDQDGFVAAYDCVATGTEITAVGDGYGANNVNGYLCTTDVYVAITFDSAGGANVTKFTAFAIGAKVY